MSYLTSKDFESICNTVKIFPISSASIGDISQYSFDCGEAKEYETFLKEKALLLEKIGVTRTFLLIHSHTRELIGYFSLSADTVRLTIDEKKGTDLEKVDFMALPALKLGKLAINKSLSEQAQRKGYGSFVLDIVNTYAFEMLDNGVACRFVTVDADIEYNPDTPEFYKKNGFVANQSRRSRSTDKTVSMRRDIFA
ncbi:MAG: hypothetical protein E7293_00050 [Lachnospiraceae bacterium]|nr:hypothetical protein [Lachnospiraceae bacterium]